MSDRQIICTSCRIQFSSVDLYKPHLLTEFHTYNTKRRMANLDPISEELFQAKKACKQHLHRMFNACIEVALNNQSMNNSQMTDNLWKCEPCKKTFKSKEQLEQHKGAKLHKKNEKIYLQNNPDMSQSSLFKSFQMESKPSSNLISMIMGSNDNESINSQSIKEEEKVQTALDSLRICLFCNKEHEGFKKCLDHMMIAHSFFIPDVDCVINLKGLLGYIAERIHLGYLCLYCSK